ncbi:MAG: hypothetical protein V1742_08015 [Pseudomonadota bacterium]
MRRDNLIRIIAVIGLCALVYYFSFDQGRRDMQPQVESLQKTLALKERTIQAMAVEIQTLKLEVEKLRQGGQRNQLAPSADELGAPLTLRRGSSRVLFGDRLVLTCLEIDLVKNQAKVQINLVKENQVLTESIGLGKSFHFSLADQEFAIIVNKVYSSFIMAQIIKR